MRDIEIFLSKCMPEPMSGCWLWMAATDKDGYAKFWRSGRDVRGHRASWEIHRGSIPKGMHVLHRCDVTSCVNPDHLFLGNTEANNKDKAAKNRSARMRGESNPAAILTDKQATEILSSPAESGSVISDRYGVSQSSISKIRRGKMWAHLRRTEHRPTQRLCMSGDNNPNSSLSEEDVRKIRIDPRPCSALANAYGVSKTAIKDIRSRKTWKHI